MKEKTFRRKIKTGCTWLYYMPDSPVANRRSEDNHVANRSHQDRSDVPNIKGIDNE